MEIDVLMKDYGKGKKRIILVDKSNRLAFVSFGEVVVLGLLLIFFPLETQHSSNYLVDLPASFLSTDMESG